MFEASRHIDAVETTTNAVTATSTTDVRVGAISKNVLLPLYNNSIDRIIDLKDLFF